MNSCSSFQNLGPAVTRDRKDSKMQFYDCITEFIFVEDLLSESDIVLIPGSICPELAYRAADLYQRGLAPYILASGKYSILKGSLDLSEEQKRKLQLAEREKIYTESEYLCGLMQQKGVPEAALIQETQATYTYENAIFSRRKLQELGLKIRKAILCCQAFHARRSLMYYQEQFPEVEFLVCPVETRGISRANWHQTRNGIDTVLGEVERCGGQFREILQKYMAAEKRDETE